MTTKAWMLNKACKPEDQDKFFPATYPGGKALDFEPALNLCRQCPVVLACRQWAEGHGDIVDGYTTHNQVVGGCAPKPKGAGVSKPSTRAPAACGTRAGYMRHARLGEPYCAECRRANTLWSRSQAARRRVS